MKYRSRLGVGLFPPVWLDQDAYEDSRDMAEEAARGKGPNLIPPSVPEILEEVGAIAGTVVSGGVNMVAATVKGLGRGLFSGSGGWILLGVVILMVAVVLVPGSKMKSFLGGSNG